MSSVSPTSTARAAASSSAAASDPGSYQAQTAAAFASAIGLGLISAGVYLLVFYIFKLYLPRIYRPRTYLVPPKERTKPPPLGWFRWIVPVFTTPNSEFIQKCGLDAYLFLRFLRLLLLIFVPLACLILPILLPINATGGANNLSGSNNVGGLNILAWSNIAPANYNRYWAHLIVAVITIAFVCWSVFGEFKVYIRLRQTYLTSPQHRLRASATTVLVTSIPTKWLTLEALDGLFDVYPGGIRNIWINRDFQQLSDKVKLRNQLANKLENAETNLIKNAKQKQMQDKEKEDKKRKNKKTKSQMEHEQASVDGAAEAMAQSNRGMTIGDPHQTQTIHDLLRTPKQADLDVAEKSEKKLSGVKRPLAALNGFGGAVEGAFGQGLGVVGHGVGAVTGGVGKLLPGRKGRARSDLADQQLDGAQDDGDTPAVVADGETAQPNGSQASPTSKHTADTAVDSPAPPRTPRHNKVFGERHRVQATSKVLASEIDQLDNAAGSHWKFWEQRDPFPSPQPHTKEGDEFPLGDKHVDLEKVHYPSAFDNELAPDQDEGAVWKKYLKSGDRSTMRLPLFGLSWMPFMPSWTFIGKKVDTIYYCRKEVARLNLEIEADQQHPERYPLMNSAFIQFNHQVAAHMACQTVSHHLPQQMAPRLIEISPNDVLWDNMSIKWWERYVRAGVIITIIGSMIVFWAIPSTFVGGLSQLSTLANTNGFHWVDSIPPEGRALIQGVLPALLTSIMFALVPIILRLLHKLQGLQTGNEVQIAVQKSYFAFLFVNLFLVVTIASGLTAFFRAFNSLQSPQEVVFLLAKNLPAASNYFFNYMVLQGLSASATALCQLGPLIIWLFLRPISDSTARQKWKRQVNLNTVTWGSFFPVYSNFAVIGMVYSCIAPLVLVFNILIFGSFWIAYRYTTLYVSRFKLDTGGRLFPVALNQLFTGLYVMEICLIGLFFLVTKPDGSAGAIAQGVIMIVVAAFTIGYQVLLNYAFGPLLTYLPITLEDEAVMRDEEFARAQSKRWLSSDDEDDVAEGEELNAGDTAHKRDNSGSDAQENYEMSEFGSRSQTPLRSDESKAKQLGLSLVENSNKVLDKVLHPPEAQKTDPESQTAIPTAESIDDKLFAGISDEIEDLTPEERDVLVDRAFQHAALRARRPVIWIPHDDLGISEDEMRRTQKLTDYIWMSNEGTALDHKGRVLYTRPPPDFSDIDLIDL